MSGAVSGSGSKVYISATLPATYDKTGYDALTWTEITDITSVGEYGREYEMIDHAPIDKRQVVQIKGNYREGTIDLAFASIPADAGQVIVETASTSDDNYAFKIVRTDGRVDAFSGKVTTFRPNVQGGAILSVASGVAIQTQVIDIA